MPEVATGTWGLIKKKKKNLETNKLSNEQQEEATTWVWLFERLHVKTARVGIWGSSFQALLWESCSM